MLDDKVPETPFTVIEYVPLVAFGRAANVNSLLPAVGLELKLALTPFGSPPTESDTLELNPFCPVTVIVTDPLPFRWTVKAFGDALSVKLAGAVTVKTTDAVAVV